MNYGENWSGARTGTSTKKKMELAWTSVKKKWWQHHQTGATVDTTRPQADLPVPQPAALCPSACSALQQRLTVLVASITRSNCYSPEGWKAEWQQCWRESNPWAWVLTHIFYCSFLTCAVFTAGVYNLIYSTEHWPSADCPRQYDVHNSTASTDPSNHAYLL